MSWSSDVSFGLLTPNCNVSCNNLCIDYSLTVESENTARYYMHCFSATEYHIALDSFTAYIACTRSNNNILHCPSKEGCVSIRLRHNCYYYWWICWPSLCSKGTSVKLDSSSQVPEFTVPSLSGDTCSMHGLMYKAMTVLWGIMLSVKTLEVKLNQIYITCINNLARFVSSCFSSQIDSSANWRLYGA